MLSEDKDLLNHEERYNGEWRDGKRHGTGLWTFKKYKYYGALTARTRHCPCSQSHCSQGSGRMTSGMGMASLHSKMETGGRWHSAMPRNARTWAGARISMPCSFRVCVCVYVHVRVRARARALVFACVLASRCPPTIAPLVRYVGDFKGDRRHGLGVLHSAAGWTYDGEWQEGVQHGHGKLTQADGTTWEGAFANGERCARHACTARWCRCT